MNSISKNRPSMRVWVKPTATFPPFAQPTVVSYFSLDQDRRFTPDTSQLRYMHLPQDAEALGWDLNHGIDSVQRSDHTKSTERIDSLLRGILASGLAVSPEVASIMCLRGLLTKVMTTPYEQNQGWEILVSKFRGVLFLCAQETPEQRRERMNKDENQKRFSSWGFKFEQYMTTDQPGCPPEVDTPVKEGEEFCCLFRTKLNDRRLIYGAEMDAVTSDVPLEDCLEDLMLAEFIELKTSRKLTCVRQERNFKRFKLLNWWAQNFLVNVANIICGFRDDRGVVENIAFYKVEEIPKMAKDLWVPAVCMTFLDQFLSFVGRTVRECPESSDPHTVWRFRWEPGVHYVTGDMIAGRSQFSFLPDWFLSSVIARENHPLEFCIRVFSTRHAKDSSKDDQHVHTAKVFELAKDIALHRARSKRPPSPRSVMQANHRSKASSSATTESVALPTSNQPTVPVNISTTPNQQTSDSKTQPSTTGHSAAAKTSSHATNTHSSSARNANGPSKPRSQSRRHRRRAREEHFSHLYQTSTRTNSVGRSEHPSFQSPSQHKNSHSPRSRIAKLSDSVSEPVLGHNNSSSLLTVETLEDPFDAISTEQSSISPNDLPSAGLCHIEEVVYTTAYGSLEDGSFLIPQSSADLSPTNSADQFSSQSFLTTSPEHGESYPQHTLLTNSLSSPNLMADCYSSHSFSVCDDLPQATYLMSPDSDFLNQQAYMQSAITDEHLPDRSYLSSPSAVEYISQPSFLPVVSTDEIHASDMYLNETAEDLPQPSMLSPVASISQTYLNSAEISSEDIQTAEGSLTTINQISSSAYLPPPPSANHLTLQM